MTFFNPRPVRAFLITRTVRGGGWFDPPPGDRPLMVVELRGKDQSMRLDEISRLHILFLFPGQYLTWLGQVKGQIFAKSDIFWLCTLIAA